MYQAEDVDSPPEKDRTGIPRIQGKRSGKGRSCGIRGGGVKWQREGAKLRKKTKEAAEKSQHVAGGDNHRIYFWKNGTNGAWTKRLVPESTDELPKAVKVKGAEESWYTLPRIQNLRPTRGEERCHTRTRKT